MTGLPLVTGSGRRGGYSLSRRLVAFASPKSRILTTPSAAP